jgi:small subunit ribosomal protein S9
MAAGHYYYGLGRRKSATAQVRLKSGKGSFVVNGKEVKDYFSHTKPLLYVLTRPFTAVDLESSKYDITVVVKGGGRSGQAEAIQLGIAKALVEMNEDLKSTLRRADMLGRDPREKERKKPGLRGARRKQQFTKR